jgi:hypothetical protein
MNSEYISFYLINENNFCLFSKDKEKILFNLTPKLQLENSNIYISHIYLKDFLVINFEKELIIIKDDFLISRNSDFIGKGKNLVLLKEDFEKNEYIIGFYDNKFEMIFVNFKLNLLEKLYEMKINNKELGKSCNNFQEISYDLDYNLNLNLNKEKMHLDNKENNYNINYSKNNNNTHKDKDNNNIKDKDKDKDNDNHKMDIDIDINNDNEYENDNENKIYNKNNNNNFSNNLSKFNNNNNSNNYSNYNNSAMHNLIKIYEEKNPFMETLNTMENSSNYIMDSLVIRNYNNNDNDNDKDNQNHNNIYPKNNNNSDIDNCNTQIYSLVGEGGNSELILYEKALKEIRLAEFDYIKVSNSILITDENNYNNKILFLNTFNKTKIFYLNFSEKNISLDELKFEEKFYEEEKEKEKEKTLEAFFLSEGNCFVQITNIQIRIIEIVSVSLSNSSSFLNENRNENGIKKLKIIESLNLNYKPYELKELKYLKDFQSLLEKINLNQNLYNNNNENENENINYDNDNRNNLTITNLKSILYPKDHKNPKENIDKNTNNNYRYLIIYFSNFKLSILKINLNININTQTNTNSNTNNSLDDNNSNLITEEFLFDYYTSISTFDVSIMDMVIDCDINMEIDNNNDNNKDNDNDNDNDMDMDIDIDNDMEMEIVNNNNNNLKEKYKQNLFIINGTYDNKLEILFFNTKARSKKNQIKKSEFFLKGNNSDIIPESIFILSNEFIFISTRIGQLAIFKLDKISLELDFIASFRPDKNEIETLSITNCKQISSNIIEINLFSNKNLILLELEFSEDKKNLRKNSIKYLCENYNINNNNINNNNNYNYNINTRDNLNQNIKNEINFFVEFPLKNNINNNNLNDNFATKISLYQNNNKIFISHFQKIPENSLLPNRLKKFSSNIFPKKILDLDMNNISILYNQENDDDENKENIKGLTWGILILNLKNFYEKKINLRMINNLKINVFKTFMVNFNNINYSSKENLGKYLLLAGEYFCEKTKIKKGIFFIFKISFNEKNKNNDIINLRLIDEKLIGNPIFDFCHMKNFLIFTCENFICSCEIIIDSEKRCIEIVPKYQQSFLNKLISCSSVVVKNNDSNSYDNYNDKDYNDKQIVVGDISESFHLMEMDSKFMRFNPMASDLNLRGLYKGKIFYFILFNFYLI